MFLFIGDQICDEIISKCNSSDNTCDEFTAVNFACAVQVTVLLLIFLSILVFLLVGLQAFLFSFQP